MQPLTFRLALPDDAPAITQLVNNAYRPGVDARGWTHESELVEGARTRAAHVEDLIAPPDSVVLLGECDSVLLACVHVKTAGALAHIGMLAVDPLYQAAGAGQQMLACAEDYAARHCGAKECVLAVITARTELMAYYLRRGYQPTGETMEYPVDAGAGTPKQAGLTVEILCKKV